MKFATHYIAGMTLIAIGAVAATTNPNTAAQGAAETVSTKAQGSPAKAGDEKVALSESAEESTESSLTESTDSNTEEVSSPTEAADNASQVKDANV